MAWTRWWLPCTRYALTDRRALVARRVPGRDWIAAVPVARFTPPTLAPQGETVHVVCRRFTAAQVGCAGRQSYAMAFWFIPDAARVKARIEGPITRTWTVLSGFGAVGPAAPVRAACTPAGRGLCPRARWRALPRGI